MVQWVKDQCCQASSNCGSGLIPGLGTYSCCGHGQKKKKKKKSIFPCIKYSFTTSFLSDCLVFHYILILCLLGPYIKRHFQLFHFCKQFNRERINIRIFTHINNFFSSWVTFLEMEFLPF